MEIKEFFNLILKKKQTIWSVMFLFLLFAVLFTAIQPLKYGSQEKLLVVQNYTAGSDPYAFSRSNEYLSNILAEVVTSNSFFNKVMESGFQIDKSYFQGTTKQQMKTWNKTIYASAVNDTGMLDISVYHTDRSQAEQIALAVGYIMKTSHQYYHGGGSDVIVKIIDEPVTSSWPVKPNIILNLSLAIIFGLIVSLSYIYLFPEEKYDVRLWRQKQKKIVKKLEEKEIVSGKTLIDGGLGHEDVVAMVNNKKVNLDVDPVTSVDKKNEEKIIVSSKKVNNYDEIVARGNINNLL